jgi:hypothetical protein
MALLCVGRHLPGIYLAFSLFSLGFRVFFGKIAGSGAGSGDCGWPDAERATRSPNRNFAKILLGNAESNAWP